jgi:hypothetical protein
MPAKASFVMSDESSSGKPAAPPKTISFAWSAISGRTTVHQDGQEIAAYGPAKRSKDNLPRPARQLDPARLAGPKLKVERAKCHITDLKEMLRAFFAENSYRIVTDRDTQTGENVFRVIREKPMPAKASAILGDIVHNLRAALDHLISDLVRANGRRPNGSNEFPIQQKAKNFKTHPTAKIAGVSAKAERLITRLKPYEAGNPSLWKLHMLDVLDKHAGIIPVAAATLQIRAAPAIPRLFRAPDGAVTFGGLPGWEPVMTWGGVPDSFRSVLLTKENVEVYRSAPALQENVQVALTIAFGQGQICEGEPVVETLERYADLVERILSVFERHCL